MNVLFIGDIVGPPAVDYLMERVPQLRAAHEIDLVIANAENALVSGPDPSSGFGMSLEIIELLLAAGVDVITSGNHSWDGPDADLVLAHPRVLRPHNLPAGRSGKGVLTLQVNGESVTILNLADHLAIPDALPAYQAWQDAKPEGTVIVDFHGGDSGEKMSFAFAAEGQVAAVLGTHTHEPTLLLHLLPGGTAFVADVGMTGASGGWGGIDPSHPVTEFKGEKTTALAPFTLASGPIVLGAVLLRIEGGRTIDLVRLD